MPRRVAGPGAIGASCVSVFTRDDNGSVAHFYTGTALLGPDRYRGIDLFTPVWHLFDLLPDGRGDWMPKLNYG